MLSLRLADIGWMESAEEGVKLHVGKHTHRLRDTLAVVAAKLPPGRFLRISRSTMVNIEQIKGLAADVLRRIRSPPAQRHAAAPHARLLREPGANRLVPAYRNTAANLLPTHAWKTRQ